MCHEFRPCFRSERGAMTSNFSSPEFQLPDANSPLRGGKLGILVGGGPAPGINGVIASVTIDAITKHGMEVIGYENGFRHLVQGSTERNRRLTIDDVAPYYMRGGSILGTSRTNPANNEEDMQ